MKYILLILAATLAIPSVSSAEDIHHCRNSSGQFTRCDGNSYTHKEYKPKQQGWLSKLYDNFYDNSDCIEGYSKNTFGYCRATPKHHKSPRQIEQDERNIEWGLRQLELKEETRVQTRIEQDILKYDCEPHFAWMDGVRYPMVPDSRCP